jgi:hypothetical protein
MENIQKKGVLLLTRLWINKKLSFHFDMIVKKQKQKTKLLLLWWHSQWGKRISAWTKLWINFLKIVNKQETKFSLWYDC